MREGVSRLVFNLCPENRAWVLFPVPYISSNTIDNLFFYSIQYNIISLS